VQPEIRWPHVMEGTRLRRDSDCSSVAGLMMASQPPSAVTRESSAEVVRSASAPAHSYVRARSADVAGRSPAVPYALGFRLRGLGSLSTCFGALAGGPKGGDGATIPAERGESEHS